MDDLFDEFLGYDFIVGADVIKCPHCEKVELNQQTGENKYFCKLCQQTFEVEN